MGSPVESEDVSPRASRKASSQRSARPRANRLTVEDWVKGALELLKRDGVAAVRIPRLCAELGVTKGSFYWHFDDIDQLLEAIAGHWCGVQSDAAHGLSALDALPVGERLEAMAALLIDEPTWVVESTIREWARSDERVDAAVRDLDRRIFDVVQKSLLELDFTPAQARIRAGALVYAGIGFVHGRRSLPTPTSDELREIFELLIRK